VVRRCTKIAEHPDEMYNITATMARLNANLQGQSRDELDARFSTTGWIFYPCMVALDVVFGFATYAVLRWINRYLAFAGGKTAFAILPEAAAWWILPLFAVLAFGFEMTLQVWSLFSADEANLFGYWSDLNIVLRGLPVRTDFPVRDVLRRMGWLIVLPVGVLTVLGLPVRASVRKDDISVCGYAFTHREVLPYSLARRLTIVQGYAPGEGPGIVLDFTNGRRWSSARGRGYAIGVDPAMADFLTKRTGLPMNFVRREADIPSVAP
jgi:hypothetical protein